MSMFILLTSLALAADWTVADIQVRGPTGERVSVPRTAEAYRSQDGQDAPLEPGQALPSNARVHTQDAWVYLEREGDETMVLHPDTELVLAEWGVSYQVGVVLYEVHDAFLVSFQRFEAQVGGTRFLIEADADGDASVAVSRGRVRVSSPQGAVLVRRGHIATLETGAPPELHRWRPRSGPDAGELAGLLGAASAGLSVGIATGGRVGLGEHTASGLQSQTELRARRGLIGPFAVNASMGLSAGLKGETGGHFPLEVGLDFAPGPFTVGGSMQVSLGIVEECAVDGDVPRYRLEPMLGGALDLGVHLPFGERLIFDGGISGGWLYGPSLEGALGLSVKL